MESGVGAEASGHGMRPVGDCWAPAGIGDDVAAGTTGYCRVSVPRHELGRTPASLTAEMSTGLLATKWFSVRNGYGAAQHVR